jgi:hypothetical protein
MKTASPVQPLLKMGTKIEIAIIGGVASLWLAAMSQISPINNPLAWLIPCGIIVVYVLFRLWTRSASSRKPKPMKAEKEQPVWWQLAIQMVAFYALYFVTTGLLRGSVEGYTEWYSVVITVVYFFGVQMVLNRFVWPKFPTTKKAV